jgi:predicted nuclease of predicted toxin-antitoxin system
MVDECLPKVLVSELRNRGHDVVWVREAHPGIDDGTVLAIATSEGRIVLTEDRGFGTLIVRLRYPAVGLVIAHMNRFSGTAAEIAVRVAKVIDRLDATCVGSLTVIEPDRVRQRPLPVQP